MYVASKENVRGNNVPRPLRNEFILRAFFDAIFRRLIFLTVCFYSINFYSCTRYDSVVAYITRHY